MVIFATSKMPKIILVDQVPGHTGYLLDFEINIDM